MASKNLNQEQINQTDYMLGKLRGWVRVYLIGVMIFILVIFLIILFFMKDNLQSYLP